MLPMTTPLPAPPTELAPGLEISRIVTGLWQVADMEKGGAKLDPARAAADMAAYAEAGFDSFDMADHYGSAEDIAGHFNALVKGGKVRGAARPTLFTKWCPTPGEMKPEIVHAAVQRALTRMQTDRIDLLQFHWWLFRHPGWIDAMSELAKLRAEGLIGHLGLTNFDTDHLRLLVKQGVPIASNQVCFSLLDRRAAGEMSAFCLEHGVRLLAYGTLAGGLLDEKWLGKPEPVAGAITDWSKMKYKRFVDQIGGWAVLQGILRAADAIAKKHDVSIANVASRWVLIEGGRRRHRGRGWEQEHRADNLRRSISN
jgi:aryl-alcohol dehydrogenase-like predicted oxidoreductase